MTGITIDEARHVAELARLNFEEQELMEMTLQLNDILNYISKLEEIDTTDVQPATHAMDLVNVFREDRVTTSISNELALANAPEKANGAFTVPRII